MSLTSSNGARSSLALGPLPGTEAAEPLFPVDPELVVTEPPSLQDGLLAAALLWCTHSTWPTVRAIASCAGVAASSVLWPYGTIDAMRNALIRAERAALAELLDDHDGDLATAVAARVEVLAEHDPRLSRLPLLVALAAGVHDPEELAALALGVRSLPAA